MTKYYKITNKNENHHGLQYYTGLVEDPKPFDPYGDCTSGGIYFASTDILAFLDNGTWIREVTLPEGEIVAKNKTKKYKPKKYKAHRVILGERRRIDLNVIKELVLDGCNLTTYINTVFLWAINNNYKEVVQYLVPLYGGIYIKEANLY